MASVLGNPPTRVKVQGGFEGFLGSFGPWGLRVVISRPWRGWLGNFLRKIACRACLGPLVYKQGLSGTLL